MGLRENGVVGYFPVDIPLLGRAVPYLDQEYRPWVYEYSFWSWQHWSTVCYWFRWNYSNDCNGEFSNTWRSDWNIFTGNAWSSITSFVTTGSYLLPPLKEE